MQALEREERQWQAQREAEREEELKALESTLAEHAEPSPSCTPPASPSLRGGAPRGVGTPAGTPSLRPPPSPLAMLAARLQLADLEEPAVEPPPAGAFSRSTFTLYNTYSPGCSLRRCFRASVL